MDHTAPPDMASLRSCQVVPGLLPSALCRLPALLVHPFPESSWTTTVSSSSVVLLAFVLQPQHLSAPRAGKMPPSGVPCSTPCQAQARNGTFLSCKGVHERTFTSKTSLAKRVVPAKMFVKNESINFIIFRSNCTLFCLGVQFLPTDLSQVVVHTGKLQLVLLWREKPVLLALPSNLGIPVPASYPVFRTKWREIS